MLWIKQSHSEGGKKSHATHKSKYLPKYPRQGLDSLSLSDATHSWREQDALKQGGGLRGRRGEQGPHQPALTDLLLLLPNLQPLPQQEALASRRGAGRGAAGPGRESVLVAGRRDLDGGQLEVLLGAADGQPPGFDLPLAGHVPRAPHLEALAPRRRGRGAGPHGAVGRGAAPSVRIRRSVIRDAHLKRRGPESAAHGPENSAPECQKKPQNALVGFSVGENGQTLQLCSSKGRWRQKS